MDRIARYEVDRLLGKGGMGEVWLARDAELGRTVALKLLQRSRPEDVARFRREARVTATLNHPGIAQLYEIGEDPPFIAMQYIDGVPLHAAPEGARITALRDAARAVHYAHEHGVLHRDLKPENILVDRTGRAFVVDFGLAREMFTDHTAVSVTGDVMGTPSYMAPEQAVGALDAIDARTDVYGLGATLYAILAGRPPHQGPNPVETVRKVIDDDPSPPPGDADLATICMKALEKSPARRYFTAAEFADDIDRWMRHEPVQARRPSLTYRLRKRIQRNPAVWALSGLLLIAVVAGAAFGVRQLLSRLRLEESRREQADLRGTIEHARRELAEIDLELSREQSDERLAELMRRIDALVESLAVAESRWPAEGAPSFLRGETERLRYRDRDAIDAYTRALECAESEWSRDLAVGRRASLGRALARIAIAQDQFVYDSAEGPAAGFELARSELEAARSDLERAGAGDETEATAAVARLWILYLDSAGGDRAAEEELGRVALEWIQRGGRNEEFYFLRSFVGSRAAMYGALSGAIDRHRGRARVWLGRGLHVQQEGRHAEAVLDFTQCLRLRPECVSALTARGLSRIELGDLEGALADFDKCVRLDPGSASRYVNRGLVLQSMQRYADALADNEEALRLRPGFHEALTNRGFNLSSLGRFAEAVESLDESLRGTPDDITTLMARGFAHVGLGHVEDAMADFSRVIELDPRNAMAWSNRGALHLQRREIEEAIRDHTEAIRLEPQSPQGYHNRGNAHFRAEDYVRAVEDYTRVLELDPTNLGVRIDRGNCRAFLQDRAGAWEDFDTVVKAAPRSVEARLARASWWIEGGDFESAMEDLEVAREVAPDHTEVLYQLGLVHQWRRDWSEADALLSEVVRRRPDYEDAYANRSIVRQNQGRLEEALADLREAMRLAPADWHHRAWAETQVEALLRELGREPF